MVKRTKKVLPKDENFQGVIHQFPLSIAKMFYLKYRTILKYII